MRYTANQPLFFPAMYMMRRFAECEYVVLMPEAQFSKFGHQSRTTLYSQARKQRITVSLVGRAYQRIKDIQVHEPERTAKKIATTLQGLYGKYEGYRALKDSVQQVLFTSMVEGVTLDEVNTRLMAWCFHVCGVGAEVVSSEQLIGARPESASEWLVSLGRALGCTDYLAGKVASEKYLDYGLFGEAGISVEVQEWTMPAYCGVGGMLVTDGSVSVLDPLFVLGPEMVKGVLHDSVL